MRGARDASARFESARRLGKPLLIDEAVGDEFAHLRVALKAIGRAMKVMDAWIAATAIAHSAAVCTQDTDFDAAEDARLLEVVRV
jgi:predicted nucleic acid-binding protein